MINKFLLEDIVCLIESFTGPNCWKLEFSKNVLPRINKNWRLVGVNPTDNEPCNNCYFYGNGIDEGCYNDPSLCSFANPVWVKKEDIESFY